jgi:hypothetical protein
VTAIIQPGGSIRDEMAIEVADRHPHGDGVHRETALPTLRAGEEENPVCERKAARGSARAHEKLREHRAGAANAAGVPHDRLPSIAAMEQLLALEMIRVTEAAAIDSARFMGRGAKDEADAAATEAMRGRWRRSSSTAHRHRRGRARRGPDAVHRRAGRPVVGGSR